MQSRVSETSPRYLAGITIGALVLTCFGTTWAVQGPQIMLLIAAVVTIALLILGITTLRTTRRLSQGKETLEEQAQNKRTSRYFSIVVGIEFASIVVAIVLLRLFKHPEAIAPVICLLVGVHFLPLAFLFLVRVYALVGIALILIGVGVLPTMYSGLTLNSPYSWSFIVGLGTALVLWLASLYLLIKVHRALHLIQAG